jgi:hypothetical protein
MINTPRRIAIIGVGASAAAIAERIAPFADAGLSLIGYIAPSPTAAPAPAVEAQVLGTLDDLRAIVQRHQIDEILIDAPWFEPSTAALASHVTQALESFPVNIRLAHDYSNLAYFRATSEDFNNITLISLREAILSPAQRALKRLFDIGFSLLVLLLTAPLFLIIAIAIRLDSPGEVIFRQQRIGQHGKPFTIYKFRTMTAGAPSVAAGHRAVCCSRLWPGRRRRAPPSYRSSGPRACSRCAGGAAAARRWPSPSGGRALPPARTGRHRHRCPQ